MLKFLFDLAAILTVVLFLIPICIFAACIAFYETGRILPGQVFKLYDIWYKEL
jgi:hypothetical protein